MLAPEVALTERLIGADVQLLPRSLAVQWLMTRWQPGIAIVGQEEVAHYGLLQFKTLGWLALSPSHGRLQLGAHRYGPDARPSLDGRWIIDSIVFGDF